MVPPLISAAHHKRRAQQSPQQRLDGGGRTGERLADDVVGDALGRSALDGKLGHGVRDLLHADRAEAGVETAEDTLLLDEAAGAANEAAGEGRVGDEADTGGLKRAEEDVGDELGAGGGAEVDGDLVVPGALVAEGLPGLDLEELDTTELEPACAPTACLVAERQRRLRLCPFNVRNPLGGQDALPSPPRGRTPPQNKVPPPPRRVCTALLSRARKAGGNVASHPG